MRARRQEKKNEKRAAKKEEREGRSKGSRRVAELEGRRVSARLGGYTPEFDGTVIDEQEEEDEWHGDGKISWNKQRRSAQFIAEVKTTAAGLEAQVVWADEGAGHEREWVVVSALPMELRIICWNKLAEGKREDRDTGDSRARPTLFKPSQGTNSITRGFLRQCRRSSLTSHLLPRDLPRSFCLLPQCRRS